MARRIAAAPVEREAGLACEYCGQPSEASPWMGSPGFDSLVCRTAGCEWEGRDVRVKLLVIDGDGGLVDAVVPHPRDVRAA